jgi:hypothetical protein
MAVLAGDTLRDRDPFRTKDRIDHSLFSVDQRRGRLFPSRQNQPTRHPHLPIPRLQKIKNKKKRPQA